MAAREGDVAAQREPLAREEAEAEQHEREAGHPTGLLTAERAEEVPVHHRGGPGQRRHHQAAQEHQEGTDEATGQHGCTLGTVGEETAACS
ncbi:hypothetical protein NPS01_23150 [Nocardioides psychrotolerans]|nr:hypothetical protein NPS01_23150 [Nocardioides psychrotolerans]